MDSRYINGKETLLHKVEKQKVSYYGHVLRKSACMWEILSDAQTATGPEAESDGDRLRMSDWTGLKINDTAKIARPNAMAQCSTRRPPTLVGRAIDDDNEYKY